LKTLTGIDFVAATVEASLGNKDINVNYEAINGFYSTYAIHSAKQGVLKEIIFHAGIKKNIIKKVIYKETGSNIDAFSGADKTIGFIFLKFSSLDELLSKMKDMSNLVTVQVENNY